MDFYKMRLFSSINAKTGDILQHLSLGKLQYLTKSVTNPDLVIVEIVETGHLLTVDPVDTQMYQEPLAWVEDRPVYVGDTLYRLDGHNWGSTIVSIKIKEGYTYLQCEDFESNTGFLIDSCNSGMFPESLTWKKPIEIIKEVFWGFINPATKETYLVRKGSYVAANLNRFAEIDTTVEYEAF